MRRVFAAAAAAVFVGAAVLAPPTLANVRAITGAGSTFIYPVLAKWAEAYHAAFGVATNYQSIGSGGGIQQITAKTVDFGASDMPLTSSVLAAKDLMQFPAIIGGEVLAVNIPGLSAGRMVLDGPTIAQIYLGMITDWDDPAIARLNPGLHLPHLAIAVVHRSDGSGTTFIFTNYLSKVSPQWESEAGMGTSVDWPVGIGGKGNEGVSALVARTRGGIGYVEYAYALQNNLIYTRLVNRDGHVLSPGSDVFQAAAANADWAHAPGFYLILTNQSGAKSWPITGATFILMHTRQAHPARARAVLAFFAWCYAHGQGMAASLDYIPMPDAAVRIFESSWRHIVGPAGQPVWLH